jgi:hypothetical protein
MKNVKPHIHNMAGIVMGHLLATGAHAGVIQAAELVFKDTEAYTNYVKSTTQEKE